MAHPDRVNRYTAEEVNGRILDDIKRSIEFYSEHPLEIDRRLDELDVEWDIERILQLNSSALSLLGLVLGFTVKKTFFLIPLAVQTFFLQHTLQGWCPPLPILRRMGFRTKDEINLERVSLKTIRGDFLDLEDQIVSEADFDADTVLEAAT